MLTLQERGAERLAERRRRSLSCPCSRLQHTATICSRLSASTSSNVSSVPLNNTATIVIRQNCGSIRLLRVVPPMCFVIARISSGQSSICIPSVLAQPTVAQSVNDQRRIPSKGPTVPTESHSMAALRTARHGTAGRLPGGSAALRRSATVSHTVSHCATRFSRSRVIMPSPSGSATPIKLSIFSCRSCIAARKGKETCGAVKTQVGHSETGGS